MPGNSIWYGQLRRDAMRLGMSDSAALLVIHADRQLLELCLPRGIHETSYPVSTSRFGPGETINSYKTPRGFHEVVERFGDNAPAGTEFCSRIPTGVVYRRDQWCQSAGDKILSRILRLAGREPGFNQGGDVDTYDRMIYLHGTNQEQFVGRQPASHGCIRMLNQDIVALYDLLREYPVWCWIGYPEDQAASAD